MATAPPPQRQSVLSERSTTGLTLLDLLEMTPDEIEAHLRATAPQPEPAILRPAVPEAQSAGLIGAELRPMNQPRDVLGEAMAEGSPPVPWVAGYAMLAGRPEDEALMWDTAAGHLGQAMTAHVALPYREFDQTISGETPLTRRRTIPAPEGEVAPGGRRTRRSVAEAAARAAQAEVELVGENLVETLGKRKGAEAVGPTLRSLLVPTEGEAVGAPIYSQARKIVEDPRTQATQTGEAWLRFLSDPKRGVKAEEFQYTGLGDLLKGKAGQRVTREEILGHLDANQIEVKEVTKGAPHEVTWEPDADYPDEVFHGRAPDAKKPRYVVMKERSGPRAGKWIMEDSVSPSRVTGTFDTQEAAQRAATYALGLERSGQPKFSKYTLPGAENYRVVLLTLPVKTLEDADANQARITAARARGDDAEAARIRDEFNAQYQEKRSNEFRSGHWDEPNVLAHLRLSDRTDADGKRVLLVEELQSDWGQKGRREGFKGQVDLEGLRRERDAALGGRQLSEIRGTPAGDRVEWLEAQMHSANRNAVPEAPFVTDTAKWTTLGLKRVLKMAADEGYDRVGIVRGEEQAARYDLSKQVDSVRVVSQGNDQFTVEAMKNGERVVHKTNLPKSELADTIGKDLADQALTQIASGPKTAAEFKGESLRIGGEGMKGYYDKIVPETLNKLAKEYGVKVKLEGGKVKTPGAETPIHTLDVPEEMRKQIKAKGLPLYSRQNNLAFLLRNA